MSVQLLRSPLRRRAQFSFSSRLFFDFFLFRRSEIYRKATSRRRQRPRPQESAAALLEQYANRTLDLGQVKRFRFLRQIGQISHSHCLSADRKPHDRDWPMQPVTVAVETVCTVLLRSDFAAAASSASTSTDEGQNNVPLVGSNFKSSVHIHCAASMHASEGRMSAASAGTSFKTPL